MNRRFWFTNRVIIGVAVFMVLVGFWEFKWKPQYRPHYEAGVAAYQKGAYILALGYFVRAYEIAPNSTDTVMMLGWTNLKLHRFEEARFYFDRVLRIDPRIEEAQMGASFVALETGRGKINPKFLGEMLAARGGDANVRILAAGALIQQGKNFEAADIYRGMLHDRDYGAAAQFALANLYGNAGYDDPVPPILPEPAKPTGVELRFRAGDGAMWRMGKAGWEKFYVTGVNLGPGAPGYYASSPPTEGKKYADWLNAAEQMRARVIRAYTLLPPGFYRAYHHFKANGGRLTLYQQIWIDDPPGRDLFDSAFFEQTKAEIRDAIDAIHGHASVPPRRARGSGIYNLDVAEYVGAILVGRELEPSVAQRTNIINAGKTRYSGKYVSVEGANPTEVWFAEMLDYVVQYETETYGWQHPVAIVNWPPTDPLTHPTESTTADEVRFRIRHGEALSMPTEDQDDNDVVAIDEAKYRAGPAFQAGLFASYHVYPYYPDFLLQDTNYLGVRDSVGPNPMLAYLRELRAHIPYPLVVTEYGMPDSLGISHFHPLGWNHGGHTEAEQAQLLDRMSDAVKESGAAGGLIFELFDEWYKHNWLTVDFEHPLDRAALWLNELDPEKHYGLIGWRTSKWKLFAGDEAEWNKSTMLYEGHNAPIPVGDGYDGARNVREVKAASDEAYVYLRLRLDCLDCKKLGKPDFGKAAYAIALNTLPGLSGFKQLPLGGYRLSGGANFILDLSDPGSAKLLIAEDYYPYRTIPKPNNPQENDLIYRRSFNPILQGEGGFVDYTVETNRRRYARNGSVFQPIRYSRSTMRYGNGNPDAPDFDSLGEWYADTKKSTIYVRLAWGKLLVTDPSSRQAFFGFDDRATLRSITSSGVDVAVFTLRPGLQKGLRSATVAGVFPAAVNGDVATPFRITWRGWEAVAPEPYFKKSFLTLQQRFTAQDKADGITVPADKNPKRPSGNGKPAGGMQ